MKKIMLLILITSIASFGFSNCQKSESTAESKIVNPVIKGKNIRKNGDISIKVENIDNIKLNINQIVEEYGAFIIEENITVNSDDSHQLRYKIKVVSENFSLLIEKISSLGKLLNLNIEADDNSNKLLLESDRIDHLKRRLSEARKSKNPKLTDELQAKLNDSIRMLQSSKEEVL